MGHRLRRFSLRTSFRNDLGNGQQALLVLVLVAAAYSARKTCQNASGSASPIASTVFPHPFSLICSSAAPIGFVAATLIPAVIGVLWAHWMVGGPWLQLIVEPLLVGKGIRPSNSDLMAMVDDFFIWRHGANSLYLILEYAVPVLAAAAVAGRMRFRSGLRGNALRQALTAVYGTAALLLFRYLGYGFVFLVFAFALALTYRQQIAARGVLICIVYFWFIQRAATLERIQRRCALLGLGLGSLFVLLLRIRYADPMPQDFELV